MIVTADDLPLWQCHKVVSAAKILTRYRNVDGSYSMRLDIAGVAQIFDVPREVFARGRGAPAVGDYIVVYESGYTSWSPAPDFEAGYTRIK
jgi:hypothetical protein